MSNTLTVGKRTTIQGKLSGLGQFVIVKFNPTNAELDNYGIKHGKDEAAKTKKWKANVQLVDGVWQVSSKAERQNENFCVKKTTKGLADNNVEVVEDIDAEVLITNIVIKDVKTGVYKKIRAEWYASRTIYEKVFFETYMYPSGFIAFPTFQQLNTKGESIEVEKNALTLTPASPSWGVNQGDTLNFVEFIGLIRAALRSAGVEYTDGGRIFDRETNTLESLGGVELMEGNFDAIEDILESVKEKEVDNKMVAIAEKDRAFWACYGISNRKKGASYQGILPIFAETVLVKGKISEPYSLFRNPKMITGTYNNVFNRGISVIVPIGTAVELDAEQLSSLETHKMLPDYLLKGKKKVVAPTTEDNFEGFTEDEESGEEEWK